MKKLFKYLFIGMFGVACLTSCNSELLETEPTDSMSGSTFMSNATKALIPLNGIYRSMYTAGWSTTGNTHQCFGITAYNLMGEVMGDDFIMGAQGSGWFWFDAAYNVKTRFTSGAWRSYDLWFAYYTWIANANYIIAAEETMEGSEADVAYVIGQAYAIRAYSYFMLAQTFARNYNHSSDPCVPIYNEPTMTSTTGQPRSTVAQVYEQIDNDINKALELLAKSPSQRHPSHMGYAVALGLKSRIALVEEKWADALDAAQKAITASKCQILEVKDFIGLNDVSKGNVMWGAEIVSDQAGMYASFMAHMDVNVAYGQRAPKQISTWLYDKMSNTDTRRNGELVTNYGDDGNVKDYTYTGAGGWWDPTNAEMSTGGYIQTKFTFSNLSTWEGDYIWMRVEEMYLTAAEAACRLGQDATAKQYLMALMSKRDPNYNTNKTGTALGALTTDETGSLLEEILIQRRLELWGEDGRIYTIRRLKQGFVRPAGYGWPSGLLIPTHIEAAKDPNSYLWVLTIPQAEFDGNENMDVAKDQNPTGDYPQ
ncbi:MAG: RagB/SusD family nutrient uptake outer membrane protein [Muribaculaceae bacterium]|nr:RagB/SusD family nutrient uptake outer membrane protein [Muribaculaceae bacterium]